MRSLLPGLWSERALADPFSDMRRELDAMFNRSGRGLPSFEVGATMPAVNVAETGDSIEITAELPGVDQKDIFIDVDGNRLIISGEKKAETKKDDQNCEEVPTWTARGRAVQIAPIPSPQLSKCTPSLRAQAQPKHCG